MKTDYAKAYGEKKEPKKEAMKEMAMGKKAEKASPGAMSKLQKGC